MFDDVNEDRANAALRAGLSDLSIPELSTDFDAAIQAALQEHPARFRAGLPYWLAFLWTACRPAIPAAVMSLCAALLLLHLVQQSPVGLPVPANGSAGAYGSGSLRGHGVSDGDGGDNLNLTNTSLRLFIRPAHHAANQRG